MLDLDSYAYSNKMARRPAEGKVALAAALITISLGTTSWMVHLLVVLVVAAVVVGFAGIPWRAYLRLYFIPLTFLFLSVFTLLISISATGEGLEWKRQVGICFIGVSPESVRTVGILLGRCLASLSGLYFLSLTTPLNQMVGVLKKIRLPVILIELVVLIYRFLHIFLVSVEDSYHALQLRNGFVDMQTSRRSLAMLVVMTYAKMMESYSDWQMVLETKNFNGDFHV